MQETTQETTQEFTQEFSSEGTYVDPYQQTEAVINEAEKAAKPKSSLIPGIVGALLGSLIGCILWIVIYKLGYIAGIAGLVTGVCAMKGYELFGRTLDKKGVIVSVIIMIVMIFFANKLAWSWEIYEVYTKDFGYDMSFFDAFVSADDIIELSELTGSYYGDLVVGYLLTALSAVRPIINAFKSSN